MPDQVQIDILMNDAQFARSADRVERKMGRLQRGQTEVGKSSGRVQKGMDKASKGMDRARDSSIALDFSGNKLNRTLVSLRIRTLAWVTAFTILSRTVMRGVNAYAELEKSLTKINTLVGVSRDQIAAWTEEMEAISDVTAVSMQDLADTMFFITSAGLRGKEAMEALEVSAEAAAVGLGEPKQIADALTSAMNAYSDSNLTARDTANILFKTVRQGKVEADALANSVSRVIPIASQLGVSFEEVGAFIATYTRVGASAEETATSLRSVLSQLANTTKGQAEAAAELGFEFDELRNTIRTQGLQVALEQMAEAIEGNEEAIFDLLPNLRGVSGFMATAGSQAETYRENLDEVASEIDELGNAMETVAETDALKLERAQQDLNDQWVRMGEKTIPAATLALKGFNLVIDAAVLKISLYASGLKFLSDIIFLDRDEMLKLTEAQKEQARIMKRNTRFMNGDTNERERMIGDQAEAWGRLERKIFDVVEAENMIMDRRLEFKAPPTLDELIGPRVSPGFSPAEMQDMAEAQRKLREEQAAAAGEEEDASDATDKNTKAKKEQLNPLQELQKRHKELNEQLSFFNNLSEDQQLAFLDLVEANEELEEQWQDIVTVGEEVLSILEQQIEELSDARVEEGLWAKALALNREELIGKTLETKAAEDAARRYRQEIDDAVRAEREQIAGTPEYEDALERRAEGLQAITDLHEKWWKRHADMEQEARDREARAAEEAFRLHQRKAQAFETLYGGLADLLHSFGAEQGAAFQLMKTFAIAEAVVSTYVAANNALKEVPFPFNYIAMAGIIATGLANVATIVSTEPGSGSGGGGGSSPTIVNAAAPSGTSDIAAGIVATQGAMRQTDGSVQQPSFTVDGTASINVTARDPYSLLDVTENAGRIRLRGTGGRRQ